ncbi:(E)-4-hydroxy-3-methylbut-2-enyl-diphosphate synthase [Leptospira sp. GIMC2001]|uniref:(E)-4-hydroxy-3-methylbut-2-enyl-diphosphate synthase n=1 Tax=Leptospira sp. GIMC2001 TaxID=1513297 RepID=UPI0023495276|nr:(E)-4-hydroxy-3-methylbut-2-enyl-diphosphate synthase [Leptospira sp. GIMC2001]WCL48206.1 (E)-4-hydroxy-3-methylbut-2-enyl-diphosphate synthase [Leptospira sp. GIMC2001]
MKSKYNESPFFYKRRLTREVKVGGIGIGGNNPIRIQSMVNTDTKDVQATIAQIRELQEAGSELVRLTVPTSQDSDALVKIREQMKRDKITVPLVADIHFTPSIAMKAVEFVEKIRINPGNFADKKKFAIIEYTDKEYNLELERISDVFLPLVKRAQELGVAMRIGTNHGSLSDRIMNRYGDSPEGMVESSLEFIRIAESIGYKDIIVSMKASNTQIMIQAYRMLVARFYELGMDYPLHLGVTEAGDGKDGRIKSAIGIGSLLDDGLGDTIRVSLTEDPVLEIPVARKIAEKYNVFNSRNIESNSNKKKADNFFEFKEFRNPLQYSRFYSKEIELGNLKIGDNHPIRIEAHLDSVPQNPTQIIGDLIQAGLSTSTSPESIHFPIRTDAELDWIIGAKKLGSIPIPVSFMLQSEMASQFYDRISDLLLLEKWVTYFPYFANEEDEQSFMGALSSYHNNGGVVEWVIRSNEFNRLEELIQKIAKYSLKNSSFSLQCDDYVHDYRKFASLLSHHDYPIVLSGSFEDYDDALYKTSIGMGGLLIDGIGDMIRISYPGEVSEQLSLGFDLLQGCRLRLTKTEYISCPSCGRTQFDLQDTTARIKKRTIHLKGVKIAVMGCIVNGPGEMADADFGYVGAAPGKVHLYRGKEIIMKNVPSAIADEKLIELIKESGMWVEASEV